MEKREKIYCNCCGALISNEKQGQVPKADWLEVTKSWGYFSNRDGKRHHFHICESCYDKWIEKFFIPAEETEETELLSV